MKIRRHVASWFPPLIMALAVFPYPNAHAQDEAAFVRAFGRVFGTPPATWRRQYAAEA